MDDVSLWGASNEVKRIAGDQGQSRRRFLCKHARIFLVHHLYPINNVVLSSVSCLDLNGISDVDIFQSAKKSIPMTGNTDISWFPYMSHPDDSAGTAIENAFISALVNGNLQVDLVHPEKGERVIKMLAQTGFVSLN